MTPPLDSHSITDQFDMYFGLKISMPKKSGRKNAGIMAVDDQLEFTVAKANREGSVW